MNYLSKKIPFLTPFFATLSHKNLLAMTRKLAILLIEDDTIEIMKVNRTISSLGLAHQIVEARNGEVALEILKKRDQLPDIIFLDLNMPKISGIEFLRILKADPVLKYLPFLYFFFKCFCI